MTTKRKEEETSTEGTMPKFIAKRFRFRHYRSNYRFHYYSPEKAIHDKGALRFYSVQVDITYDSDGAFAVSRLVDNTKLTGVSKELCDEQGCGYEFMFPFPLDMESCRAKFTRSGVEFKSKVLVREKNRHYRRQLQCLSLPGGVNCTTTLANQMQILMLQILRDVFPTKFEHGITLATRPFKVYDYDSRKTLKKDDVTGDSVDEAMDKFYQKWELIDIDRWVSMI